MRLPACGETAWGETAYRKQEEKCSIIDGFSDIPDAIGSISGSQEQSKLRCYFKKEDDDDRGSDNDDGSSFLFIMPAIAGRERQQISANCAFGIPIA